MNEIALLIAATLSAGTVLAIAALGLLINERSRHRQPRAEGLMLVAAIAGFAAAVHSGSDLTLGFAGGHGRGALLAALGRVVIWLNTNQYARAWRSACLARASRPLSASSTRSSGW